jgi:hypothetical protein
MRNAGTLPVAAAGVLCGLVAAGSGSSFAQEPQTQWTFSLGARETNEFARIDDGEPVDDRIMDAANTSLGFNTRTEKDQFGLFGRIGANVYRSSENRERLNYGAGFSWARQFSVQSQSRLSLSVDRGFRAETLTSLGLLAPGADTFATNASWTLAHQATPRTSFSTSFNYHHIDLETDEPIPGSQIVPDEPPFIDDFPPIPPPQNPSDDGGLIVPDVEDTVVDIIATEGLTTNQNSSHHAFAGFGVNHLISEYSQIGFDLSGGYRMFDSETSNVNDGRDGAQAGFRVYAQRRVGQASSVGTNYSVSRSLVMEPPTTIHNLVGTYGYAPTSRNISFNLSAGAAYYQAESLLSRVTPVVNAAFSAGLTRSTQFGAAYRRQFSQSIGFGRTLLMDYMNVSLTQNFGSRVDLTLRGAASFATDPLVETSGYDVVRGGGGLTWRVVDSVSLGTTFYHVARDQNFQEELSKSSRNVWSVYANYVAQWR